jgi:hypothetical protein
LDGSGGASAKAGRSTLWVLYATLKASRMDATAICRGARE